MEGKGKVMKKKIAWIVGIIVVIVVAVIAYMVVSDSKQEELLKQEIVNLSNKDLAKDDFSIEVKTKGDYAYIEESIKKYYKELSDNVKKSNELMSDEDLINILSPSNLAQEDETMDASYQKVTQAKVQMQQVLQNMMDLCTEEKILSLIDKEKVDSYYYDLYKELMYTEEDLKELEETRKSAENLANTLDDFFDKVLEILDFLQDNYGDWYVEDDQLYLLTDEQVEQYNQLYEELQDLASELETLGTTI